MTEADKNRYSRQILLERIGQDGQEKIFRSISGVPGTIAGVIGALKATECLKLITGLGKSTEGKLLSILCHNQ